MDSGEVDALQIGITQVCLGEVVEKGVQRLQVESGRCAVQFLSDGPADFLDADIDDHMARAVEAGTGSTADFSVEEAEDVNPLEQSLVMVLDQSVK
ncbi:hypothetical protein [Streptomyces sp. NPDC002845]